MSQRLIIAYAMALLLATILLNACTPVRAARSEQLLLKVPQELMLPPQELKKL